MLKHFEGWKLYVNSVGDYYDGVYIYKNYSSVEYETIESFDGLDDIPEAVNKLLNNYNIPYDSPEASLEIMSVKGIVYLTMRFTFEPNLFNSFDVANKNADSVMNKLSQNTGLDVISADEKDYLDYYLMIPASKADEFENKYHCLKSDDVQKNLYEFTGPYYDMYFSLSKYIPYENYLSNLYALYQLDWIMKHGYTLEDVLSLKIANNETYLPYEEFLAKDYQNEDYIHDLINRSDLDSYQKREIWEGYLEDTGKENVNDYSDIDKHYYVIFGTDSWSDSASRILSGPFVKKEDARKALYNHTIKDLENNGLTNEEATSLWHKTSEMNNNNDDELYIGEDNTCVYCNDGASDEFLIVEYQEQACIAGLFLFLF